VVDGSGDTSANGVLYDLKEAPLGPTSLSVSNGPTITFEAPSIPSGGGSPYGGVTSITVTEGDANDTLEADSVAAGTSVVLQNPLNADPKVTGAAKGRVQVNPPA
jgi:hypothetical protein